MPKIFAAKSPEITQRELDHMALSRSLAGECVVLLENDKTLPLSGPCRLALYGSGARQTIRGGSGSGDVNTRSDVNIEQGLEKAGFQISTKPWLDRQDAKYAQARKDYLDWIPRYAREQGITEFLVTFSHPFQVIAPAEITESDIAGSETDTAVYVISRTAGEGADRFDKAGDYRLYEEEKAQLELLGRAYGKVIAVLNIGGLIDLSQLKAIPGISALLLMGQLGNIGGEVLADVLLGKVNPSGKLTDTWAQKYGDYPSSETFSHNDGNIDDEYYTEGIYIGYRYFDTFGSEPLYPFGYGMSYTDFQINPGAVTLENRQVKVTVSVTNTGCCPGKEVVQVYYSAPDGKLPKPYQELAGFAKTGLLAPGEEETLIISFPVRDMASYCESCAAWVLEAGDYIIRAGSSSRDTRTAAVLTLDTTVKTELLKNLFAGQDPVSEIAAPTSEASRKTDCGTAHETICETARGTVPEADSADGSVPYIRINAASIETNRAVYQEKRQPYTTEKTEALTTDDVKAGRCTVEELVSQLSVEEMAQLCVGTLRAEGGSLVGNASYTVPGAAGDTSSVVSKSRGIRNLILADGPAGLRLQPVFKTDKEGNLLPGGSVLGDITEPFDPKYTDENSDTYYQYCTAIPIGWSLAQSWNMDLLEQIGSMVGEEMEEFGVDL